MPVRTVIERGPESAALTTDGLRDHRAAYVAAMRAYNAGEVNRRMRSWTLPFLIRHSAFHTLDHAWEMEDKDLPAVDKACPPAVAEGESHGEPNGPGG